MPTLREECLPRLAGPGSLPIALLKTPKLGRVVKGAAGQALPVSTEGHRHHRAPVAIQRPLASALVVWSEEKSMGFSPRGVRMEAIAIRLVTWYFSKII